MYNCTLGLGPKPSTTTLEGGIAIATRGFLKNGSFFFNCKHTVLHAPKKTNIEPEKDIGMCFFQRKIIWTKPPWLGFQPFSVPFSHPSLQEIVALNWSGTYGNDATTHRNAESQRAEPRLAALGLGRQWHGQRSGSEPGWNRGETGYSKGREEKQRFGSFL